MFLKWLLHVARASLAYFAVCSCFIGIIWLFAEYKEVMVCITLGLVLSYAAVKSYIEFADSYKK